jgi:FlaA1/EpsC-like NDP-sugar epimerase
VSAPAEILDERPDLGSRVAGATVRLPPAVVFAVLDALFVTASYLLVLVLRYEGNVPDSEWADLSRFVPLAVAVQLGFQAAFRLYRSLWRFASVQEARRLLLAGGCSTGLLAAVSVTTGPRLPVTVLVFGGMTATALVGASRFRARLFAFNRSVDPGTTTRALVVGAGAAGAAIIRSMLEDRRALLEPVGIVDDDPRTWGRDLLGVRIHGGIAVLPALADRLAADEVVLAIASAGSELVRRVADAADAARLPLKVIPSLTELVDGQVSAADVRDLRVDDLLGRRPVDSDLHPTSELLRGRVVLVTGAGGSIGSEISRQVAACDPAHLVLLDHDETHLHDVTTTLDGPVEAVLADIRDARDMDELFASVRPEIVFHAAALKHVPILEEFPCEAVRTNVLGTRNVVHASRRSGVRRLVFVSTDKAVKPSSVMGASKWVAERLVLAEHPEGQLSGCAVRFGNVLGSRGSVTPTFARQIASGGPVTVTDARMTRFFMSTEEAVQLVLVAAAIAEGHDIFMLDMGQPVSIVELAEKMIRLSGRRIGTDIELRVTGQRPGEKLHEELHTPEEGTEPTVHPSIERLRSPSVPGGTVEPVIERLETLAAGRQGAALARVLVDIANGRDDVIDLRGTTSPAVAGVK